MRSWSCLDPEPQMSWSCHDLDTFLSWLCLGLGGCWCGLDDSTRLRCAQPIFVLVESVRKHALSSPGRQEAIPHPHPPPFVRFLLAYGNLKRATFSQLVTVTSMWPGSNSPDSREGQKPWVLSDQSRKIRTQKTNSLIWACSCEGCVQTFSLATTCPPETAA